MGPGCLVQGTFDSGALRERRAGPVHGVPSRLAARRRVSVLLLAPESLRHVGHGAAPISGDLPGPPGLRHYVNLSSSRSRYHQGSEKAKASADSAGPACPLTQTAEEGRC